MGGGMGDGGWGRGDGEWDGGGMEVRNNERRGNTSASNFERQIQLLADFGIFFLF